MNEANNEKLETDPGADVENAHKPKVIRVMSAEIEDAVQKMGKFPFLFNSSMVHSGNLYICNMKAAPI
jgi:hypothetical protein